MALDYNPNNDRKFLKKQFEVNQFTTKTAYSVRVRIDRMLDIIFLNKNAEEKKRLLSDLIEAYAQRTKNEHLQKIINRCEQSQSDGDHLLNL